MIDLLDPAPNCLNVYRMHIAEGSPDLSDSFVQARGRYDTFSDLIDALLAFGKGGERLAPGHVFSIDRHPPDAPTPSTSSTRFACHTLPARLRRPDMRHK